MALIKNMSLLDEEQQDTFIDEDDLISVQYRPLDEHEKAKLLRIKTAGQAMLYILDGNCAEFTIARSKVVEAVMWAVRGVAK